MSTADQVILLGHVFADRVAWFIAAGETIHGRGVAFSGAELRMVQIRAGLAQVALAGNGGLDLDLAIECHPGEWRRATPAECDRLALFFTRTAQGKAYQPTGPQPVSR